MTGALHTHRLCPRCYASLAADSTGCGRCGAALPAAAATQTAGDLAAAGRVWAQTPMPAAEATPYCPRCDRLELPGGRFTGALANGPSGACPHCGTAMVTAPSGAGLAYEEVSLTAESWDLDRLVRAEAVDGWTLVDTTIDPSSPQRLLAHFRRPLAAGDPQANPASQEVSVPGRQAPLPAAQGVSPRLWDRPPAPSQPSAPTRPAAPSRPTAPQRPAAPPPLDAHSAKAAAKEARRAAKEAQRTARWERRRVHWEERLTQALEGARPAAAPGKAWGRPAWKGVRRHPAAIVGMLVATMVGISLVVGLQVLRHVALPIVFAVAMALRQAVLSLFWGITGPNLRQGARRR